MQDVRIIFIECIYTSGIIGQILLCLTPKRCQRCSMMLGFHCIEVIGSCKYFHFTKMVLVMELKINSGFLTSCKHCYSSRADVAVKHSLSQSDGNPCPISNLNSLSIFEHALLGLRLHWLLSEGFISVSANSKRSQVWITGMGEMLIYPARYSCVLLITK